MTAQERDQQLESDVDAVVTLCGGSLRAAIRTLLIINATLQEDNARLDAVVSKGFSRGVRTAKG